jgi:hypothetical protein
MALLRIAKKHAREIRLQDWSDAHSRIDGARHRNEDDSAGRRAEKLAEEAADRIRLNVVWAVGQTLHEDDPNFDVWEFAKKSGVSSRLLYRRDGKPSGGIAAGLRHDECTHG